MCPQRRTGGAGFAFFITPYYATPSGQLVIDRALPYVPVLGDVLRKSEWQMTRTANLKVR